MKTGLYLGNIPIGKVITAEVVGVESGIKLQEKEVTPSKSTLTIKPETGYVGLSKVTVVPIPEEYIKTITTSPPNPNDMKQGVEAYANGEEITGTLGVKDSLSYTSEAIKKENNNMIITNTNEERIILEEGATIKTQIPSQSFGNARTSDVKSGVTFTSENGVKLTGTHTEAVTPEVNLQAGKRVTPIKSEQAVSPDTGYDGFSNIIVESIPDEYVNTTITSNAAESSNIEKSKKAYVNGKLVEGSLSTATSPVTLANNKGISYSTSTSTKTITTSADISSKAIYKENTKIKISFAASDFGNATAEDVTSGKTFTSSAGYKATGTRTSSSTSTPNVNLEENKEITPSKATQEIGPSQGYAGFKKVTVNPIPSNYIDINENPKYVDTTITSNEAGELNIENNKKAYVNGELITGKLTTTTGINIENGSITNSSGSTTIQITGKPTSKAIHSTDTNITMKASLGGSGEATVADVRAGKTFTSKNGYCLTGELIETSSGSSNYTFSATTQTSAYTLATSYGSVSLTYGNGFTITENGIALINANTATGNISSGVPDTLQAVKNNFILRTINNQQTLIFIPSNSTLGRSGTTKLTATNCVMITVSAT